MKVVVAPVADFKPGDRRIITIGGRSIGVFRVGDRFYGIRNRCPHQGGPLCQGQASSDASASMPNSPGPADSAHGAIRPLHSGPPWCGQRLRIP